MNDGVLQVSPTDPRDGRHASIDLFFRDLAVVHRERAFCLVLSGTGSDGAVGLSRIKEQGVLRWPKPRKTLSLMACHAQRLKRSWSTLYCR